MPSMPTLIAFAGASLLLLVTPGPVVTFVIARSIDHGRRAGVITAVGADVAILVHVAAAVIGVSAILAASPATFTAVRLAGALYLVWLGARTLRQTDVVARIGSSRTMFAQGFMVNLLNPKTALFFLAFLPQFVDRTHGEQTVQLLTLGLTFFVLALVSDTAYAFAAGSAAGWLRGRGVRARRVISGCVTVALGVAAGVSAWR